MPKVTGGEFSDDFKKKLENANAGDILEFKNMRVHGEVKLKAQLNRDVSVKFIECFFSDRVNFEGSEFRSLEFKECIFKSELKLNSISLHTLDVNFVPGLEEFSINLERAKIADNCLIYTYPTWPIGESANQNLEETISDFKERFGRILEDDNPDPEFEHSVRKIVLGQAKTELKINAARGQFGGDFDLKFGMEQPGRIGSLSLLAPDIHVRRRLSVTQRLPSAGRTVADLLPIGLNAWQGFIGEELRIDGCRFGVRLGSDNLPALSLEGARVASLQFFNVQAQEFSPENSEDRIQVNFDANYAGCPNRPGIDGMTLQHVSDRLIEAEPGGSKADLQISVVWDPHSATGFWHSFAKLAEASSRANGRVTPATWLGSAQESQSGYRGTAVARMLKILANAHQTNQEDKMRDNLLDLAIAWENAELDSQLWGYASHGFATSKNLEPAAPIARLISRAFGIMAVLMLLAAAVYFLPQWRWVAFGAGAAWLIYALQFGYARLATRWLFVFSKDFRDLRKTPDGDKRHFGYGKLFGAFFFLASAIAGWLVLPRFENIMTCWQNSTDNCNWENLWKVSDGALFGPWNGALVGLLFPVVFIAVAIPGGMRQITDFCELAFKKISHKFIREGMRPLTVLAVLLLVWAGSSAVFFLAMAWGYMAPEETEIFHAEFRVHQADLIAEAARPPGPKRLEGSSERREAVFSYHRVRRALMHDALDHRDSPEQWSTLLEIPLSAFFQACRINWARPSMIEKSDWIDRVAEVAVTSMAFESSDTTNKPSPEGMRTKKKDVAGKLTSANPKIEHICALFLPAEYSNFQPFAYAADVVIPLLELRQQDEWSVRVSQPGTGEPLKWAYFVLLVETICTVIGWICALVLAGALTGLADPSRRPYQ